MTRLASRSGLILLAAAAVGGYLLLTGLEVDAARALPYLPLLLLLACPLLHVFMHGGRGHGGARGGPDRGLRRARAEDGAPSTERGAGNAIDAPRAVQGGRRRADVARAPATATELDRTGG